MKDWEVRVLKYLPGNRGFIGYFQELINWKKIDLINSSTGVLIFETEKQFENLERERVGVTKTTRLFLILKLGLPFLTF